MSEPVAIVINTDVLPGADGMYRHDVLSEIRLPNQAELFICPDPRIAELETVLRECRGALVLTQDGSEFAACLPDEWSFAADKDWNQMKEAIAKIDEVLNEDR